MRTAASPFFAHPLDVVRHAEGVVSYASQKILSAREEKSLQERLTWWFLFRTAAISLLLVLSFFLRTSQNNVESDSPLLLYGVCALSYGSILAGAMWIRKQGIYGVVALAHAEVFIDAGLTAVLVLATGGHESAFIFFFSLNVLGAAAVLDRRGALLVASINAVLYFSVLGIDSLGWLAQDHRGVPLVHLLPGYAVNVLAYYLVAFMGGFLTDQLQETSERLSAARDRVVELERLHEAVLHSLPMGVLTLDERERVVFVNQSGAETLASTPPSLVGQQARDILPQLPSPHAQDRHASFKINLDRRGESPRVLEGHSAKLLGFDDAEGRVVLFEDVTELRSLEQEHVRNLRLATVGRFAAGLAHEVRNPLAAMMGCLDLLETDLDELNAGEDPTRLIRIAQREAERLSNLVTAFLTYARPAPPQRRPTLLLNLLEEVLETYSLNKEFPDIVVIEPNASASLAQKLHSFSDPEQLKQVLWNLLQNAGQALGGMMGPVPDAHGPKKIRVSIEEKAGNAFIHVDDSGPGIKDEHFEQLFAPFFTTRQKGTGLGLAESHQLIVAQGGSLFASPSLLKGARFTIRLPLLDENALLEESPVALPSESQPKSSSGDGDSGRVLPVSHPAGVKDRFPGKKVEEI
ncbi:MAG: PAS domain-containing protein [Deltaproteobacteria bacterium]|nr:PAS domain-containing protein [Deltaproteobacteria bacterium]